MFLRAYPKTLDFGSRQGRSAFSTAGIGETISRIEKERERSMGPKDEVFG